MQIQNLKVNAAQAKEKLSQKINVVKSNKFLARVKEGIKSGYKDGKNFGEKYKGYSKLGASALLLLIPGIPMGLKVIGIAALWIAKEKSEKLTNGIFVKGCGSILGLGRGIKNAFTKEEEEEKARTR